MSRADELRATLSRCQGRARYAERKFNRFCSSADLKKPEAQTRHKSLKLWAAPGRAGSSSERGT